MKKYIITIYVGANGRSPLPATIKTNDHARVEASYPQPYVVAPRGKTAAVGINCIRNPLWLPSKGIACGATDNTRRGKKSPLPPGEGQGEGVSYRNNPLMLKKAQKKNRK
jgi:hypothetical protein